MNEQPSTDNEIRGTFVKIPKIMMESDEWRKLTPLSRAAYSEVCYYYNGFNNGKIGMSSRHLARILGCAKSTAWRALKELTNAKFLEVMREGLFRKHDLRATEYRITALRCDRTGRPPNPPFPVQ